MAEQGQAPPPPYAYPAPPHQVASYVDQYGNLSAFGATQYISNYTNVGHTAAQHIGGDGGQAQEVERLRQQLQQSQAREQQARERAARAEAENAQREGERWAAACLHDLERVRRDKRARARNQAAQADNQRQHPTASRKDQAHCGTSGDRRNEHNLQTGQMHDDPMDIDQDCMDVSSPVDPNHRVVQVGGNIFNTTRYEMIFGRKGPLEPVQETMVSDFHTFTKERRNEETLLPSSPAVPKGYTFNLTRQSYHDVTNIRIFNNCGTSWKPIRKFYLKVSLLFTLSEPIDPTLLGHSPWHLKKKKKRRNDSADFEIMGFRALLSMTKAAGFRSSGNLALNTVEGPLELGYKPYEEESFQTSRDTGQSLGYVGV
ncbi:uncharacterized protein PAC_07112 [Phialocephala subalpina]|uniref:Uncharacterized protein n=1 Tax=Phialocephala subalpina TaxID=576137 RepID=A0A1L7WWU5_9HELO|nr:uncharacterized protein PAC_07112 [Phialocephala subalpina]